MNTQTILSALNLLDPTASSMLRDHFRSEFVAELASSLTAAPKAAPAPAPAPVTKPAPKVPNATRPTPKVPNAPKPDKADKPAGKRNRTNDGTNRTASDVIRDNPNVSAAEIVEIAKGLGLTIAPPLVYNVRQIERNKVKKVGVETAPVTEPEAAVVTPVEAVVETAPVVEMVVMETAPVETPVAAAGTSDDSDLKAQRAKASSDRKAAIALAKAKKDAQKEAAAKAANDATVSA